MSLSFLKHQLKYVTIHRIQADSFNSIIIFILLQYENISPTNGPVVVTFYMSAHSKTIMLTKLYIR